MKLLAKKYFLKPINTNRIVLVFLVLLLGFVFLPTVSYAAPAEDSTEKPANNTTQALDTGASGGVCGEGENTVKTMINIGCRGKGNPILDLIFAIIRVMSIGVGLVVIGSMIVAGIQYTMSAGEPAATAKAIERIRNTFFALLLFIFAYAIINWLVPAGLLN